MVKREHRVWRLMFTVSVCVLCLVRIACLESAFVEPSHVHLDQALAAHQSVMRETASVPLVFDEIDSLQSHVSDLSESREQVMSLLETDGISAVELTRLCGCIDVAHREEEATNEQVRRDEEEEKKRFEEELARVAEEEAEQKQRRAEKREQEQKAAREEANRAAKEKERQRVAKEAAEAKKQREAAAAKRKADEKKTASDKKRSAPPTAAAPSSAKRSKHATIPSSELYDGTSDDGSESPAVAPPLDRRVTADARWRALSHDIREAESVLKKEEARDKQYDDMMRNPKVTEKLVKQLEVTQHDTHAHTTDHKRVERTGAIASSWHVTDGWRHSTCVSRVRRCATCTGRR
jgi:hypothetical protein